MFITNSRFAQYRSKGVPNSTTNWTRDGARTSLYHGVPVELRDEVLAYFRSLGISVKLAYRGKSGMAYRRKQSYIHRYMATSFAVYTR